MAGTDIQSPSIKGHVVPIHSAAMKEETKVYFVSSQRNYSYKDGNNQIVFGEQKNKVLKMWLVFENDKDGARRKMFHQQ